MLTKLEILTEYGRCLYNPTYAIESYLTTFDKTQEGFVPFQLFPRQKEIIQAYEKHRFNLVAKPRQAGVSTTTAAYMAIKGAFADKKNPEAILIIANKQDLAFEFLGKIKDFVSQLPRWVWGSEYYGTPEKEALTIFSTDSKKEIKLPNGSRIKAVATSKGALRGFTPTYLIMDEAAHIDNGAEVFSTSLTALGCLTKDSLILTDNGLVELNELVIEKDVLGFSDLESPHIVCDKFGELTPATKTFVSEYGKTFKIKTKLGIELEGSWKHPLLIKRGGEELWVKMSELIIGDKPLINYNQNYFGKNSGYIFDFTRNSKHKNIEIPKLLSDNLDFCYLLGLFVSEGNFYNGGITITNKDKYISDFLINDKAGLNHSFKLVDDRHHSLSSIELVKWFESFGLKKHNARDKEIPLAILKMPKEVIVNFLQGMFDGDGMSTTKDIKYSSTSKKLIQTLQTLLLNFGIVSHIKKEIQKTSISSIIPNKDHICTIYNLKIYSDYAIKFYDEIGFRLDRKQINKKYLINKKNNSRFVNVSQNDILKILKNNNIPKYDVRFLERFWSSKYERLSYESLKQLIIKLPDNKLLNELLLQKKYNEKYFLDEIVDIQFGEDYTYDLHVPKTNSFISNGLISHNTGGHCILISTPNGMDALYYTTYENAKNSVKETSDGTKIKTNNFNVVEMRWYEDLRYNKGLTWTKGDITEPEIIFNFESYEARIADGWKPQSPWYEYMCLGMNGDARMIAQELDVSFIGSGGNVVAEEFIEFQTKNNQKDPIRVINNGETWIWADPEEGHQYIQAVDVSRGDSEDSSTIIIIDFTTMEEVLEYKGKIQPDLLAQLVEEYGNAYKAYTIVDITGGMGVSTVLKLLEFQYKYLHYDTPNGKILSSKQRELTNYGKTEKNTGFHATSVRIPMISNLEYQVRTNGIKIRSRRLLSEFKTFVYKNGRPDHMDGFHDDLIMALGMGLWVLEYSFKNLQKLEKQSKAMLGSWIGGSNSNKSTQLENERGTNFVSKNKVVTPKPKFNPVVARNMQDPNGQYMWLFSGSK